MANLKTIKARVGEVLYNRLKRYIDNENRRGRSIDDSSVMRDAVVEFLDRQEQRLDIYRSGTGQVNDLPPVAQNEHVANQQDKKIGRAAVKSVEEASSPTDHGAEVHLEDRRRAAEKKTHPAK